MRKSIFFYFFSYELPLILGVGEILKKTARDIYKRTLDIEFERDRSIGLGSMIGDGRTDRQTNRQTHTHTFFKNAFLDCGSDVETKTKKKSKSNFFTIAILLHS